MYIQPIKGAEGVLEAEDARAEISQDIYVSLRQLFPKFGERGRIPTWPLMRNGFYLATLRKWCHPLLSRPSPAKPALLGVTFCK